MDVNLKARFLDWFVHQRSTLDPQFFTVVGSFTLVSFLALLTMMVIVTARDRRGGSADIPRAVDPLFRDPDHKTLADTADLSQS